MTLASGAVAGAFLLDVAVGEPPDRVHPVAWFGRVVGTLDRDWGRPRAVGVVLALSLPVIAAGLVGIGVGVLGNADWRVGLATGAVVLFLTTSLRALLTAVYRVDRLATSDLPDARSELRALAGREATDLDAAGIRSAALESLAENLADGLVAPVTAFATGAVLAGAVGVRSPWVLALACACAVWLKAVNTMDSMVGYRHRPLGFGAAKADDVAMWVPARLTALLLAAWLLAPGALGRAREWASDVPSPNSGWPMGVMAAGLDVRLEKPGEYVLHADGAPPAAGHVRRALGRVALAGLSAYALAGVVAWY